MIKMIVMKASAKLKAMMQHLPTSTHTDERKEGAKKGKTGRGHDTYQGHTDRIHRILTEYTLPTHLEMLIKRSIPSRNTEKIQPRVSHSCGCLELCE
jgi:hypothetical protein